MNLNAIRLTATLATLSIVGLFGCNDRSNEPSVGELARRQQVRETIEATQPKTVDERIRVVRGYLDDGNLVAAQAELRPLVISSDSHPEVVILAARCRAAEGDKAGAATMLVENNNVDQPTRIKSLFLAAKWFADDGDYESAELQLQRVLELYNDTPNASNSIAARRKLATLFNDQGRRIKAYEQLKFLADQGVIHEKELFAMNTLGDPFVDTTAEKPDFTQRLTPAALSLAKLHRHQRDIPKARELIKKLALQFPESTAIAAFEGRIYADLRDLDQLIQWSTHVPQSIQVEPEYWFAMGVLSDMRSEPRQAVRCFIEAVKRDPTDRFSYLGLAQSLEQLSESDAAHRVRERFETLDQTARLARKFGNTPGSPAELDQMAQLLFELRRDSEAIAWKRLAMIRLGAVQSDLRQLDEQRAELVSNPPLLADEPFVTCGLIAQHWPLPTIAQNQPADATDQQPLARPDSRPLEPVEFIDHAADVGIDFTYENGDFPRDHTVLLHQLTGGGIGVLDLDLDGWPDIYLAQGGGAAFDAGGSGANQLFRNLEGQRFTNVTASTHCGDRGYSQGIAVADLNQDGFSDLIVANIGPNHVYINQGDGTFQASIPSLFDQQSQWTTSIACGDLNGDGRPEIVELNYVDDPTAQEIPCTSSSSSECNPSSFQAAKDRIWSVTADGRIIAADELLVGGAQPGYGFAAIIANMDGQAGNDLFIANDTIENFYWLSQSSTPVGDGSAEPSFELVEKSHLYGCATGLLGQRQGCMGIASGDFDRNGRMDLHVTNYWNQPADLYLQRDNGFFVHASLNRGLNKDTKSTVAWGTQAADFDHNGWLDLAVLNGHLIDRERRDVPYRMRPQLFLANETGFELMPSASRLTRYWQTPRLGRTMATLDWNADLKPDLICNHLDSPVVLLENQTHGGNSLQFELVGVSSERDAVSASVRVRCGQDEWTAWIVGGDGFLCTNQKLIDIGIGAHDVIDVVQVGWPSGRQQTFSGIKANERYLLIENEVQAYLRPRLPSNAHPLARE